MVFFLLTVMSNVHSSTLCSVTGFELWEGPESLYQLLLSHSQNVNKVLNFSVHGELSAASW